MDFMDSRIFRSAPHVGHEGYIRWLDKVESKGIILENSGDINLT
jgi:hypothetical protein